MAAEYVLKEGNPNVLLCERGIRTFETAYRFTLDLTAVPVLKELTHLPVIVDPSHAAGRRASWQPLSLAAAAAGADGIIVEVHPSPTRRSATARSSSTPTTSPSTPSKVEQAAAVAGKAAPARRERPLTDRGRRRRPDRRLDRAGRARAARRATVARLRPGGRRAGGGARARRARRRRASLAAARSTGADVAFVAAPVRRAAGAPCATSLAAAAPATAWSPTSARPSARRGRGGRRPALHRRPPAGGRRDGRGRARARRPVRGRHLVPDADAAHRGHALRAPAPAALRPRRAAGRRSTPTRTTA